VFCKEEAAQLRRDLEEVRGLGANLVIIGCGTPEMAADFAARHSGGIPIFTDPERKAYEALGFIRTVMGSIGPRVALPGLKAMLRGFAPGSPKGDALQQGGVAVISPSGKLLYRHAARHSADRAPLKEIMSVLARKR
jgi:hypothetical protein